MKLIIDIPKEFEKCFQADRFERILYWLSEDAISNEDSKGEVFIDMLKDILVKAVPVPPHEGDLIDRNELYAKTVDWEQKALRMVLQTKKVEEWLKWSVVLAERTAFKHDIADVPAVIRAERKE